MIQRRYLAVLTVAAFAGCQQLLGITPATLQSTGGGGNGGVVGSSTSSLGSLASSSAGGASTTGSSTASSMGGSSTATTSSGTSSHASSGTTTSSGTSASGTSSSSGDPCAGPTVVAPGDVIDNMEADSPDIIKMNGREGPWFTVNSDPAINQFPATGGECLPSLGGHCATSFYAMNTYGSAADAGSMGFAFIGFALDQVNLVNKPYDASGFTGIAFWGMSTVGPQPLHVQFQSSETVAVSGGGTCTTGCGDSFAESVILTGTWQQFTIPFSMLEQGTYGAQFPTFDSNALLTIQFSVDTNTPMFNFWIDDVGFYH
jgi:hypothetical protein